VKRRVLITLLGGAVAAWPLAPRAQQAERIRKIGILVPAAIGTPQWQAYVVAFRAGLRRLGWVDGRNVQIAERWGSDADELAAQAAELARISPDVILAAAASATRPMHQATRTIPIVFANVPDPVTNGFVAAGKTRW
jgi:putative ABC transport system substrate-binding protein